MGGALILIIISATTLGVIDKPLRLAGLAVTMAFGLIGWIDDYLKISRNPLTACSPLEVFWAVFFALAAVLIFTTLPVCQRNCAHVPFSRILPCPWVRALFCLLFDDRGYEQRCKSNRRGRLGHPSCGNG